MLSNQPWKRVTSWLLERSHGSPATVVAKSLPLDASGLVNWMIGAS